MKKVFLFSSILLGVVLLFWGIYEVAFRNNPSNPKVDTPEGSFEVRNDTSSPSTNDTPLSSGDSVIEAASQEKVISPVFRDATSSVVYLSLQDASVKEIFVPDTDGRSIMELPGLPIQAVWSPDVSRALIEMDQAGQKRWHLIDLQAKSDTPLKPGIENPAWGSMGDKIVYKYYDDKTKERSLNVANPDGTGWQKIADTPFKTMRLAPIPKTSLMAFWNEGNAFEETSLRSFSLLGNEDPKTLLSGQFGADYRFSPDGLHIVASLSPRKGGSDVMLMLMNSKGGELRSLALPTLASKVAWSNDNETIYCALPGALPPGAVLPNDYYSKPILTQDTFWRVDTTTGKKDRLVSVEDIQKGYDATRLFTDKDEGTLFFVNRVDGKLYRMKL